MNDTEHRAYTLATRSRMLRWSELWFMVCTVALVLWWPLDFWIFDGPTRTVMAWMRGSLVALHVAALLLLRTSRWLRARPDLLLPFYHTAAFTTAACAMAHLGSPSTSWFGYLYFGVLPAALEPMPLRWRIPAVVAPVATGLATYFLMHPAYMHDPMTPSVLFFSLFLVLTTIVIGEAFERYQRRTFLHMHALARAAGGLRDLNEELEGRLRDHLDAASDARTQERQRIARELHDGLGQELLAARLALTLTKTRHRHTPTDIADNLQELERILTRTSTTMRELIVQLRPRVVEELGLSGALEWLARELHTAAKLTVHLQSTAAEVPADHAATLYRFVQEALTNVARHAGTAEAWVTLDTTPTVWNAEVLDFGRGINAHSAPTAADSPTAAASAADDAHDPPAPRWSGAGHGLIGMQERASALGGHVRWGEAEAGRGTRITMTLPRRSP